MPPCFTGPFATRQKTSPDCFKQVIANDSSSDSFIAPQKRKRGRQWLPLGRCNKAIML